MIEKLKWITWSIMPLVYDESLSYVELLDKVIAKLNEVIEATNNFTKPVQETIDAWLKSNEGQAAVEQSVGEFIVAYSKTPSFQQVLVSALENQSAEVKAAASEAAKAYLNSPEGKTALDTEIRDYMLVYTKTDEFKNLISEYVMELNDILRGDRLDIRQKNSTTIQTPTTVISSTEIATDYSAGSAKSRVEVNSSGVHIYSDEDMSTPAISASNGVVSLGKNLDAKTHRIMNLPTPEAAHEAANKFYVDQAIAEIPGGGGGGGGAGVITVNVGRNSQGIWTASKTYEQIAVNINSGNIVKAVIRDGRAPNALTCSTYTSAEVKFTGVVAIAQQEVEVSGRKKPSRYYVTTVTITNNNQVSIDETEWNNYSFIHTDGSTSFTNAQSMGNNQLRDLAAPTKDTDAATKGYVDSHGGGGGGGSGGGGGVSLGEFRLFAMGQWNSNIIPGEPYHAFNQYRYYFQAGEDDTNPDSEFNEMLNTLKLACSTAWNNKVEHFPMTATFLIRHGTEGNILPFSCTASVLYHEPVNRDIAVFGFCKTSNELGASALFEKGLYSTPTPYSTVAFLMQRIKDTSTGKYTYQLSVAESIRDVLNDWACVTLNGCERVMPSGFLQPAESLSGQFGLHGGKIESDLPSIMLIPSSFSDNSNTSTTLVAMGTYENTYDNTSDNEPTAVKGIKYSVTYPALNNVNVLFTTVIHAKTDLVEAKPTLITTASGVPDIIDGTITVGDDGTISAVTLNGLNKTLLSGIWSWKHEWDCSSELSLTYLTVGETNFKYTFKLARAYKVNPNSATSTIYGLDFECDNGDYKMVITQTFDTASETVPAATYKTVKYGGGGSSEYGVQIVDFEASGIEFQTDKASLQSIVVNGISKTVHDASVEFLNNKKYTTAVTKDTTNNKLYSGTLIRAEDTMAVFYFPGIPSNTKRYARISITSENIAWSTSP